MDVKVFTTFTCMFSAVDNSNGHQANRHRLPLGQKRALAVVLIDTRKFIRLLGIERVCLSDSIMSDEEKIEWSNVKSLHKDRFLDSKQTTFDIDHLHPEARRRLQMLGFLTINDRGEQQEVTGEEVDAILLKRRRTEEPDIIADKYMMHHGLYELFKVIERIIS